MTVNTLDEERTEVWRALLDEAPAALGDADRGAACHYLLRHLVLSGGRPPAAPAIRD
jgi:hypothetical protein